MNAILKAALCRRSGVSSQRSDFPSNLRPTSAQPPVQNPLQISRLLASFAVEISDLRLSARSAGKSRLAFRFQVFPYFILSPAPPDFATFAPFAVELSDLRQSARSAGKSPSSFQVSGLPRARRGFPILHPFPSPSSFQVSPYFSLPPCNLVSPH